MSLDDVALGYIQEQRAKKSDSKIRKELLAQKFSRMDIDEAFARAGPRVRSPWIPAYLALFTAAAVLFLGIRARYLGGENGSADLAGFAPAPLSEPRHLSAFLPDGLQEADAAGDYTAVSARLSQQPRGGLGPDERLLLAAALSKRDCRLTGAAFSPVSPDDLAHWIDAMTRLLAVASKDLAARATERDKAGDAVDAAEFRRRLTLLGWHFAQDWEPSVASRGMEIAIQGVLSQSRKPDAAKAVLELRAYVASPEDLAFATRDASEPTRIRALNRAFADPAHRRAYGLRALLAAAVLWSPEEVAAAKPDPSRARVQAEAEATGDPRLKALAAAFEPARTSLQELYAQSAPERRPELASALRESMRRLLGL
jgi:hypothetical protein